MNHFFPVGHPVVLTLFLMDMTHHTIIPVLQGEATTVQLDRRMQHIQQWRGDHE